MKKGFVQRCLFKKIYETETLYSENCEEKFITKNSNTIFCSICRKKVSYQRYQNKNYGRPHPRNKYNKLEPSNVIYLPYRKFQQLPPEKIMKIGRFNVNGTTLSYRKKKK